MKIILSWEPSLSICTLLKLLTSGKTLVDTSSIIPFNKSFSSSSVTWLRGSLVESIEVLGTTSLDLALVLLLLDEEPFLPLLLVCLDISCGTNVDKSSHLAR